MTAAFQYMIANPQSNAGGGSAGTVEPRMEALAMGPERMVPGVGPIILAAEVAAAILSPRPAGDANDNGFPPMPEFNGKTTGYFVTEQDVVQFVSGWGGPATGMPKGSSGYDIVTRTHVEGNVAAYMQQQGITNGTLYINNPNGICSSCSNMLPRMLAPGSSLTVWPIGRGPQTFVGVQR